MKPRCTFAMFNTTRHFKIQDYPSICDVATRMALDNDCINRDEPVEPFYKTCDQVIADRTHEDLTALEAWVTALKYDERDTLADGEESDINALVAQSPIGGPDNTHLALLFNDIFEAM